MKLSLAFLAAAPAVVSGKFVSKAKRVSKTLSAETDLSNVQIEAGSKTGNRVLSKARRLDGGDEFTWVAGYSLKFHSCTSSQDYYGGYFTDNNNNNNNNNNGNNYNYNGGDGNYNGNYQNGDGNYYYNGEDRNDYQGMYQQKLVHFQLCPSSSSCWSCKNGADYVVELGDFVAAVLEAQMTAQEYNCEKVREQCYCDNANYEETCIYNCFKNANMEVCAEAMYEEEFALQDAAACAQLEVEDEDLVKSYIYANMERSQYNNGYYDANGGGQQDEDVGEIDGTLYVGPYCSNNGKKIHLGVFMEETCSVEAPKGIYEAIHYGDKLPYSKKSLLPSGCISCKEPVEVDYNNYWDQQDADEVTESCETLYATAGKCEEGLDGYYPNRDVTGCNFISTLKSTGIVARSSTTAKVFAGIFAASTAALAAVAMTLQRKNSRQNVSLAGEPMIS